MTKGDQVYYNRKQLADVLGRWRGRGTVNGEEQNNFGLAHGDQVIKASPEQI